MRNDTDPPSTGADRSWTLLLTSVAVQLGRHTVVYSSGFGGSLVVGLLSLAILTRLLEPGAYGRLGLLLLLSAMLTILYNLGSLQGSFRRVYGASEDEELDEEEEQPVAVDKRKALGTAIGLTTLIGIAGTALIASAAPRVAELLTGDADDSELVVLAAGAGALGAVWRLVSNIPRLERRPRAFVLLQNTRPVLVLVIAVTLVASGQGIEGVLFGTAGGTLIAIAIGLVVSRRSFVPAFNLPDARAIMTGGASMVPVVVAFWVIQNADLYVLSLFASDDDVGIYRAASRIGSVASYFVSAFLMAWTPLRRTSLFAAAQRSGGPLAFERLSFTYFVFAALYLLVCLVAGADAFVRIAGPEYVSAAPLIPLLGLAFAMQGTYVVAYRSLRFPHRRRAYVVMAIVSAVTFLVAAVVLTPPLGAYGAALAPTIGFGTGCLGLIILTWRGPLPVPIDGVRVGKALLIAAGCVGLTRAGHLAHSTAVSVVADLVSLCAYPLLLVVSGALPGRHLRPLRDVASRVVTADREGFAIAARLGASDRELLRVIIGEGVSPEELATRTGRPDADVRRRFFTALSRAADVEATPDHEDAVVTYLLSDAPVADRDAAARRLWALGVDPGALARLESAVASLRRSPSRVWAGDQPEPVDGGR